MARGKGRPIGPGPKGRTRPPRRWDGPPKVPGHGRGTNHKSSFASQEMIKAVYLTACIPLAVVLYVVGYFAVPAVARWLG